MNHAQQSIYLATCLTLYYEITALFIRKDLFNYNYSINEIIVAGITSIAVRVAFELLVKLIMFDYRKYIKIHSKNNILRMQLDDTITKLGIKKDQLLYIQYVELLNKLKRNGKQVKTSETNTDRKSVV